MMKEVLFRIRNIYPISNIWLKCFLFLCIFSTNSGVSSFTLLKHASRVQKFPHLTSSLSSNTIIQQKQISFHASVPTSRTLLSSSRDSKAEPTTGISSELIAQLAIIALKLRLEAQSDVKCKVNGRTRDLMIQGKVGPVTVNGRGWESPLGLTCRAIEATVQECSLDVRKIIKLRKLKLTVPCT